MGPKSWSRAVIKGRGPLVAVAGGGRVQVLACRDQCGGRGFWQGSWAVAVVVGLRLGTCSRVELAAIIIDHIEYEQYERLFGLIA